MTTKQRIARAALNLFVERGIAETSIRKIAEAAGISEGAIYRHYPSKGELAWELFHTSFVAFARELEGLGNRETGLKARIHAYVHHFCRAFDEDWVLFSYLLLSQHGQLKRVTPDMPHPVNVVRDSIAEAMEGDEIPRRDPELATAMVLGLVLQTALSSVYGRIDRPMGALAEELSGACWRVLER